MKSKLKKAIYSGIMVLMGIGITVFFIEIGAMIVSTVRYDKYHSATELFSRQESENNFIEEITRDKGSCRYIDTLFPHPYLGFVHHANPPCGISYVNNIGLFGEDFPSEKPSERFVILLTGGSVAAQFAQMMPPPAPKYLEELLNEKFISPNGKPFLILNGGDGGWKQPQSLILFLQYADVLDAVVTLDGFNEHYMIGSSSRFEFPSNNFMTVNPLVTKNYGQVVTYWVAGKFAGEISSHSVLRHSHAAFLFTQGLLHFIKSYGGHEGNQVRTSMGTIFGLPPGWSKGKKVDWAIGQYKKYIQAMDAVASQRQVRAIHFIQPIPGYGKKLTKQELEVVGSVDYAKVYLPMTEELLQLNKHGSTVISLLDVFEKIEDTIYADHIHPVRYKGESKGYSIMADRIGNELALAWNLRSR